MKKETKFNYGLLFTGLALPIVADYFLGKAWGVIVAMVVGVIGAIFLAAGHTHREEGESVPVSRRRKMAAFAVVGAVVSLALMGIRAVYAHEFVANYLPVQSNAKQSSPTATPPQDDQVQQPLPTPKQGPVAPQPQTQNKGKKKHHSQARPSATNPPEQANSQPSQPAPTQTPAQPTYQVTNPIDSIVNQDSPNYGTQTVNNGPLPPSFRLEKLIENRKMRDDLFVSEYTLDVKTAAPFSLHVT